MAQCVGRARRERQMLAAAEQRALALEFFAGCLDDLLCA
jgi:hypothetical protein